MTDIHTIKNLFYFFPYLKVETWYMLGMGIVIFAIYIIYLAVFEKYSALQNRAPEVVIQKKSIQDVLGKLSVNDPHFFEHLSLIIRTHLEESGKVRLATKKTARDINTPGLQEVLRICEYYEYTGGSAPVSEKIRLINQTISSII